MRARIKSLPLTSATFIHGIFSPGYGPLGVEAQVCNVGVATVCVGAIVYIRL